MIFNGAVIIIDNDRHNFKQEELHKFRETMTKWGKELDTTGLFAQGAAIYREWMNEGKTYKVFIDVK